MSAFFHPFIHLRDGDRLVAFPHRLWCPGPSLGTKGIPNRHIRCEPPSSLQTIAAISHKSADQEQPLTNVPLSSRLQSPMACGPD